MKKTLSFLIILALSSMVNAEIVFQFHNGATGADLDEKESGTSTVDGITLSASTDNAGDVFNDTGDYFGINASAFGDDTDQIDNGSGVDESFTFSFDTATTITRFDFAGFDGSGQVGDDIAFISFATHSANNQNFHDDTFDNQTSDIWDVSFEVDAGEDITMGYSDGSGFAIDSLTVIPEPTTFALLGLLGLGAVLSRRLAVK